MFASKWPNWSLVRVGILQVASVKMWYRLDTAFGIYEGMT